MQKDEGHFTGVVIDGLNLAGIVRTLGGYQTNYRGLRWVITHIGERNLPLLGKPVTTIPPQFHGPGHRMYEEMKRADFDPIPISSRDSMDDAFLVKRIKELCADPRVYRVLLIGCDHWLIRELIIGVYNRLRAGDPLRAYVLGTCCCNSEGRLLIKKELLDTMSRSRAVRFVDLADHQKHFLRR